MMSNNKNSNKNLIISFGSDEAPPTKAPTKRDKKKKTNQPTTKNNIYDYKVNTRSEANILSMCCRKCEPRTCECGKGGVFNIPISILHRKILNGLYRNFCFIELKTEYFKLFFDLDLNNELEKKISKTADLWKFIISKIDNVLKYYIKQDVYNYLYSDRKDTTNKLHLYYPDIILNKYQAQAIRNRLIYEIEKDNKFLQFTMGDYNDIVDESVFKSNGIRLLFNNKPHQDGFYTINRKLSTYQLPKNKCVISYLQSTSIRTDHKNINVKLHANDNGPLLLQDTKKLMIPVKKTTTKTINKQIIINNKKHEIFQLDIPLDMVIELFNNIPTSYFSNYTTWIKIIYLCRNYGLYDIAHELSQRASNYDKNHVDKILYTTNTTNNNITTGSLFHWSMSYSMKKHVEILKKYAPKAQSFRQLKYMGCYDFDDIENCEKYNKNFVDDLDVKKYSCFIVKSGLGGGKTEKAIKAIVDSVNIYGYKKISVLSSRIVLCTDLHARFNEPLYGEKMNRPKELKMKLYNTFSNKRKLKDEERLVQTPDSLIHMINNNGIITPDILFVDEIESMFDYITCSDTIKDTRKTIFLIFCEYIRKAKQTIFVDGNISKFITNVIRDLRKNKDVKLIHNTKEVDNNNYYVLAHAHEWNNKLLGLLGEGKKLFITADSKRFTDRIYQQINELYPKLKVGIYNLDTCDKEKMIKNVNEEWGALDVVIVSPTILYGVNFSLKDHFDYTFGYYQGTITSRSVYQQVKRVRHLTTKKVFLYIDSKAKFIKKNLPTTKDEIFSYMLEYHNEYKHVLSSLSQTVSPLGKLTLDDEDLLTKIFIHFQIEKNKCYNDILLEYTKSLSEFGGKVILEYTSKGNENEENKKRKQEKEEYKQEIKRIDGEIKEKQIKRLNKASKNHYCHDYYINDIQHKMFKTREENDILTAYRIKEVFKLETLSKSFLKDLGHLSNVDNAKHSLVYFANGERETKLINSFLKEDINFKKNKLLKQKNIIKEFINLYWKNGLLDKKTISVYSKELSEEEQKFINKNMKDIKIIFDCVKNKGSNGLLPATSNKLFGYLEKIIQSFFGNMIYIKRSKRKRKRQGKGVRIQFFDVKIKNKQYLKLLKRYNIEIRQ